MKVCPSDNTNLFELSYDSKATVKNTSKNQFTKTPFNISRCNRVIIHVTKYSGQFNEMKIYSMLSYSKLSIFSFKIKGTQLL